MPNPKRRHSKRRKNQRRAHDHLTTHSLSSCPKCHEPRMPHQVCPKCGFYKGRAVISVKS
ncbi:MAG: 50S ribosomal protein L32 [Acidobacteria bacterium]|nr:50S ribosomal protein L32 [Acidobacteriota bacterium]